MARLPEGKALFYLTDHIDTLNRRCHSCILVLLVAVLLLDARAGAAEVATSLSSDGRVGKIVDHEGLVTLRPVLARRWTPVTRRMLLKPGDWLRADVRGANAVKVKLLEGTEITLGPGSLLEVVDGQHMRVLRGEFQIEAAKDRELQLSGPNKQPIALNDKQVYRVTDDKLARIDHVPIWLKGFEGSAVQESLGSLIANVDGRNTPLTIGYHKVNVDIRDQIARTTIEESFVNHTDSRLEGIFYFPLPQDASISGFGMWIDGKLVEADVVEKQRAREIYETILCERRDPGLLEWTGGNIFKARVFPIFAHSEKRIKITYTQVLSRQGNRYRYSYGLQSEMLQRTPLRELNLDVKVSSAVPLREVACPTHAAARVTLTDRAGLVEFTAQEYTPTRDFEVVVEIDSRQDDVVVIPHRRVDDGYLLLQLNPPATDGNWQRETLADGDPIELLILADTSASMDDASRERQSAFIASLLSALSPQDRFNVAVCDVECEWLFEEQAVANEKNLAKVRNVLDQRASLGWTDLARTFNAVEDRTNKNSHVIYIGDGVVTARDEEPVEFANRVKRQFADNAATFHAVSVTSSFESVVLKAVASLGGGSMRSVSGEAGPQAAAVELLHEITRPGMREMRIEFQGFDVAGVYPEELPNVKAGSQQIVLARYLPQGENQQGDVVVTGKLNGNQVRYSTRIAFADAESGNSFIPRLWARQHLDHLLAQGATPAIRDEIIGLSEEYHIITPYTSLLVLESDADRERFGVKRRFQMRDGEKFFSEGRDNANYALLQQQMKIAGEWRLNLRRQVLRELSFLGRDSRFLNQPLPHEWASVGLAPWSLRINPSYGGGGVGGGFGGGGSIGGAMSAMAYSPYDDDQAEGMPVDSELDSESFSDEHLEASSELDLDEASETEVFEEGDDEYDEEHGVDKYRDRSVIGGRATGGAAIRPVSIWGMPSGQRNHLRSFKGYQFSGSSHYGNGQPINWLIQGLFPHLPHPASNVFTLQQASTWPDEAIALSKSLLHRDRWSDEGRGVRIVRKSYDTTKDDPILVGEQFALYSPTAWLTRSTGGRNHTVNWCDEAERGVVSQAFLLGRVRKPQAGELATPPLNLNDGSINPLHESLGWYEIELTPQGDGRVLLATKSPSWHTRILIDTERHVVLRRESLRDGKIESTRTFSDFIEVAGSWWATREVSKNAAGQETHRVRQTVELLPPRAFEQRMDGELAIRERCGIIRFPSPTVPEAKQAVAAGTAGVSEHLMMILHYILKQQWDQADKQLASARAEGNKPGLRWLHYAILQASRRHEQLRDKWMQEAAHLVLGHTTKDDVLADYLLQQARQVLQPLEMLELLDVLKPVYERQPPSSQSMKTWTNHRITYLMQTGKAAAALALQRRLAEEYRDDHQLQNQYAAAVARSGDYDAAYAWLREAIPRVPAEQLGHKTTLRDTYTRLLREQGKLTELVEFLEPWLDKIVDQRGGQYGQHAQYLHALVASNQSDRVNAAVREWLALAKRDEKLGPAQLASLNAAVAFAKGEGFQSRRRQIDPAWLEPLADTTRVLLQRGQHFDIASGILRHHRFGQSDTGRQLAREVAERLIGDLEPLPPRAIVQVVSAASQKGTYIESTTWVKIAESLHARWLREEDADERRTLGQALVNVYVRTPAVDDGLTFLREQLAATDDHYRSTYRQELFAALLAQEWSPECEDEAFALWRQMGEPSRFGGFGNTQTPEQAFHSQVVSLYALGDRMVTARYRASEQAIEHPERLTRMDLQRKRIGFLREARDQFAERLGQEIDKHDQPLANWLRLEAAYLDMRLRQKLDQAEELCWAILGDEPLVWDQDASLLDGVLFQRCLAMATSFAVRPSATPKSVERLIAYIDRGIAQEEASFEWKLAKYQLLVALDRPEELARELRNWIRTDEFKRPWQISLANLLAEQGKLDEAISIYEAVERGDDLVAAERRNLAHWYLAEDQRDDFERALTQMFSRMNEYQISDWIDKRLPSSGRRQNEATAEVTPDVLIAFREMFRQAQRPEQHVRGIGYRYHDTRDFRLLTPITEAVVGQTAAKVYPLLTTIGHWINEVEEEAAVDAIAERIAIVRERAKTAADHRALDLLQLLNHRHAATLINQPGPHIEKALSAMKRAFDHEWLGGERRLAADFLAALGKMEEPSLAEEQRHQLRELYRGEKAGWSDRLHISQRLAETLWVYNRRDRATRLLELTIREYENTLDDGWPQHANMPMMRYASYLGQLGRFGDAERVLQEHYDNPVNDGQQLWFMHQLNNNYAEALKRDGLVSHGSGQELYEWLEKRLREQIAVATAQHRVRLVQKICSVYRTADAQKLEGVKADLRAFAGEPFRRALHQQANNANALINPVANALHDVNGYRDHLEFFIYHIEHEPARLRQQGQTIWQGYLSSMADSRTRLTDLGDLEPRLLKIVLRELERQLVSDERAHYAMYHKGNRFWTEKEADFRRVAERVYAGRKESGSAVQRIAAYVYGGLQHYDRGIEMLMIAHKAGLLREEGQHLLANYLHEQERWQESIAILRPLVRGHREKMAYTAMLMRAYFHTDRGQRVVRLLNAADEFFREDGRWTESHMMSLGNICMECKLHQQAAGYYKEAISLHQRTQPNRGIGRGTVSNYYASLSRAYSELKQTGNAVDAAASAIVAWGPNHQNRQRAVESLAAVFRQAEDLDAYMKHLDRSANETGQDRPIVRKMLGIVLQEKNDHKLAVLQLKLAAELQPNDEQTHNKLIECYQQLGDGDAAFRQLLRLAQLKRHDFSVYERMANVRTNHNSNADPFGGPPADDSDPFAADPDPFRNPNAPKPRALGAKLRERVLTSIVEVMPQEAASHQKLAEIRERDGRWDDAILHWKQVHRTRSLEPTGLLGLAKAQIHQKQWSAARETLDRNQAMADYRLRTFGAVGGSAG